MICELIITSQHCFVYMTIAVALSVCLTIFLWNKFSFRFLISLMKRQGGDLRLMSARGNDSVYSSKP